MEQTGGSEVLSTKISKSAAESLARAAKRLGTNRYVLMQTFVDCLLRFIDDWGAASQDLQNLMQILVGNFYYLLTTSGISNVKDKPLELESAIIFMHEKGKAHQTAAWLSNSWMGQVEADFNVQHMFEKFLKVAMPAQYNSLKKVAKNNDMSSLVEALNYLCLMDEGDDDLEASVKALFADNDRIGFGQSKLSYDKKYKGVHHFSVDTANVNRTDGQRHKVSQTNLFDSMENLEEPMD